MIMIRWPFGGQNPLPQYFCHLRAPSPLAIPIFSSHLPCTSIPLISLTQSLRLRASSSYSNTLQMVLHPSRLRRLPRPRPQSSSAPHHLPDLPRLRAVGERRGEEWGKAGAKGAAAEHGECVCRVISVSGESVSSSFSLRLWSILPRHGFRHWCHQTYLF